MNRAVVIEQSMIQVIPGMNHRTSLGDLSDLKKSIADLGICTPLWVRPDAANEEQPFILIAGQRRLTSFRQLLQEKADLNPNVPVVVFDVNEDEAEDLMALENLERDNLVLSDEVKMVSRYRLRGFDNQEIARRLHRSIGWVEHRVTLSSVQTEVVKAVDAGIITTGTALRIARKSKVADQSGLLKRIILASKGNRREASKKAADLTKSAVRPGKRQIHGVAKALGSAAATEDAVIPVGAARDLLVMALSYCAGESAAEQLLPACIERLKLQPPPPEPEQPPKAPRKPRKQTAKADASSPTRTRKERSDKGKPRGPRQKVPVVVKEEAASEPAPLSQDVPTTVSQAATAQIETLFGDMDAT